MESSQEFDTTSEKIEAMALVSESEECDRIEDRTLDTTGEKIEAMALVSESEKCDRIEDHKVMDDNGIEDHKLMDDNGIEDHKLMDDNGIENIVNETTVSKGSSNQPNSSQLSQSSDDMLGFINTPPSRVKLMKKSAPKVKRVKQMHESQDLYFLSPSQNSQGMGVSEKPEGSDKDESADTEVTFKTPLTKEHVGKSPVKLESPIDLFSQISPPTLQAACKAAECANVQYQPSRNECTTQEGEGDPCSTGFEICDNGDDNLLRALPLPSGGQPLATATSTPIASNCDKDLDVDITPIGKMNHNTNTPVRWKKVVSTKDAEIPSYKIPSDNVQSADETRVKLGFGLRRKAKRFSYPSSSQIRETCPKKVFNFEEKCDNQAIGKKDNLFEKGNPNMNEGNVENQTNSRSHFKHDSVTRLNSEKGGNVAVKPYWKRYTSGNCLIKPALWFPNPLQLPT